MTPHIVGGVSERGCNVDGRHAHIDGVGVDKCKIDDVLDGFAEQLHRDVDIAHDLQLGLVIPLVPGDIEQFNLSLNGEHRRAQLMLRRVKEIALQLVQLAETAHRFAFLLEGSGVLECYSSVVCEGDERAFVALGDRAIRGDDAGLR